MEPYTAPVHRAWSVASTAQFTLRRLDSDRQFDVLRVYEGADGEGPLVRAYHGTVSAPVTFTVRGGAYVTFSAPPTTPGGQGFELEYK